MPADRQEVSFAACDHCDDTGEVLEPSRTPEEPDYMIPCANCQDDTAAWTWEESRSRDAQGIWRTADALIAEAARMENEARRMRDEAERLNRLAADVADGRIARGVAT